MAQRWRKTTINRWQFLKPGWQDSAAQRKLRVNKKGISLLGVEKVWIWPWRNISDLISCILLSSLHCPTFLNQMLSKPMGFIHKVTTHFPPGSWKLYPTLPFPHEIYTFSSLNPSNWLFCLDCCDIFFIPNTNFMKLNEQKWLSTWGVNLMNAV